MTGKEESIIEKVEKELAELQRKRLERETNLKADLVKAQTTYDNAVVNINARYNITEFDDEIKRHTYFLKLLNGEVAIPDDLNAKKGKAKTASATKEPSSSKTRVNWSGKFEAVFKKLGKTAADNVTAGQVKPVMIEMFPEIENVNSGTLNSALVKFKKENTK